MRRQPRIRITRKPRRLGSGCTVPAGTPIVTMGKTWLCAGHQPWLKLRNHAEVLAAARDRDWDEPSARRNPDATMGTVTGDHGQKGRTHLEVLADYRARGDDVSAGQGRV